MKAKINKSLKISKLKTKLFTVYFEKEHNTIIYIIADSIKEAYNKFKESKFKNKFGKSFFIDDSPQYLYRKFNIISKNPNKSYLCQYEVKNKSGSNILIAESIEQCFDYLKDLDLENIIYHEEDNKFIF